MFTQSSWVRDLYSFIKMRSAIARTKRGSMSTSGNVFKLESRYVPEAVRQVAKTE